MLTAAVLLIAAILLFGSSAVIGALGAIAGFITFCAFLAYIAVHFSIDPGLIIAGLAGTLAVIVLVLQYGFGVDMTPDKKPGKKK